MAMEMDLSCLWEFLETSLDWKWIVIRSTWKEERRTIYKKGEAGIGLQAPRRERRGVKRKLVRELLRRGRRRGEEEVS